MPPEPNDQMVTAQELGDEDLQQWLTSLGDGAEIELPSLSLGGPLNPPTPTDTDPTGGTDEPDPDEPADDGDEPEEVPAPAQATGDADHFVINGEQFSRDDIERLYNFDQYMRANPDVAQRVNTALTAPAPAAPAGGQPPVSETPPPADTPTEFQTPEPPDFLDLEDPAQKFQWDTHVATQRAFFDREQRDNKFFQQQAQERIVNQQRQAEQDMASALTTFKQAHPNLNEDDIVKIRQAAGPFIDGMMKQLPPTDALVRSMEVAAVMDNDLRAKIQDPTVHTRTNHQQRQRNKQRLGAISGSPRSAPKTESRPAYSSDKDFLNALAQEFSEHMQR